MSKLIEKNITLDKKHTEMIAEFKYNEETLIPKLKQEIDRLNKFLNNSKNNKKKIDKIEIAENKIKCVMYASAACRVNESKHLPHAVSMKVSICHMLLSK